jgi:hypothetical protein
MVITARRTRIFFIEWSSGRNSICRGGWDHIVFRPVRSTCIPSPVSQEERFSVNLERTASVRLSPWPHYDYTAGHDVDRVKL